MERALVGLVDRGERGRGLGGEDVIVIYPSSVFFVLTVTSNETRSVRDGLVPAASGNCGGVEDKISSSLHQHFLTWVFISSLKEIAVGLTLRK